MLMAGMSALPFRALVTVTANITAPQLRVGINMPSSPSAAATETSTGVTAFRVNRACRTSLTGATWASPSTPLVRKGITTSRSFS
ncbi:hypothetical protein PF003_g25627 [Phytophthora fragariae]|nr:hypothetical protein PF003_g37360 [Phytophthora fragariae]KAE8890340.1 hypothetical protein PF003_g25627 [Phytophthora fragariae]